MFTLFTMIVVFLSLSAIMAAVDSAVLSVSRPEIEELVQKQLWGARRLREVKKQLTHSLVVVVVLTNTINVLGPVLISHEAFARLDSPGVVATTIVLTLSTIVFSEILPKAMGAHYAPLIARLSSPLLMIGRQVLYPIVVVLAWLSDSMTRGTRRIGTEPQIRSLVQIGHKAGLIESDEEKMIHRVFILNDRTAKDILTPLNRIRAISASMSFKQAIDVVFQCEFSRYPLFGVSTDEVIGIILSRDLLRTALEGHVDHDLLSIAKPTLIVNANDRCDDLLVRFRDEHLHMAVVQENGHPIGIVTLEDVLEQLVGAIDDEKDVAQTK